MTNYNERLDDVLEKYEQHIRNHSRLNKKPELSAAEAKQALTSLTKELVADAKPEKRTPDYYSDSIDLYSRQCAANSWNNAIDQFEQSLLKALEEK